MKKQIILYTTRKCAKCKSLKNWLKRNNLSFVEKDLADIEVMADLVMRNIVALSAPVLEAVNRFFLSDQIFGKNNSLQPSFIKVMEKRK